MRYLDVPGVLVSPPNATMAVVLPMELCEVLEGQMYKKRLPSHLTSKMVGFSSALPEERLRAICSNSSSTMTSPVRPSSFSALLLNSNPQIFGYANSEHVKASGMQISLTPMEVRGRLLAPPQVVVGKTGPGVVSRVLLSRKHSLTRSTISASTTEVGT